MARTANSGAVRGDPTSSGGSSSRCACSRRDQQPGRVRLGGDAPDVRGDFPVGDPSPGHAVAPGVVHRARGADHRAARPSLDHGLGHRDLLRLVPVGRAHRTGERRRPRLAGQEDLLRPLVPAAGGEEPERASQLRDTRLEKRPTADAGFAHRSVPRPASGQPRDRFGSVSRPQRDEGRVYDQRWVGCEMQASVCRPPPKLSARHRSVCTFCQTGRLYVPIGPACAGAAPTARPAESANASTTANCVVRLKSVLCCLVFRCLWLTKFTIFPLPCRARNPRRRWSGTSPCGT